jgi:L-ascorbate metabolism protein UlaG (beta-lactamase superfamily)
MPVYCNPGGSGRPHGLAEVFRWGVWERYVRRRRIDRAGAPAPAVAPDLELLRRRDGPPRLTWIGHASFLGSLGTSHFLIDPVFSTRVGWFVRRHGRPVLTHAELPEIDALLLTHNHYDHLDGPSVRRLDRGVPAFVPRGLGSTLRRWGFRRVVELAWWEAARSGPLEVTLVPAHHWSRRGIRDTNRTLWGGYVVRSGKASVYHCGDSGWFDGFAEIGRRFPGLLTAMLPIGAYAPGWFMEPFHMNPEQAGRAFLGVGARTMVPMHWGTFKLTDESLGEPIERLCRWWERQVTDGRRALRIPAIGETLVIDEAGD